MAEERPVDDGHHRLGRGEGQRAQARAFAAGQDDCLHRRSMERRIIAPGITSAFLTAIASGRRFDRPGAASSRSKIRSRPGPAGHGRPRVRRPAALRGVRVGGHRASPASTSRRRRWPRSTAASRTSRTSPPSASPPLVEEGRLRATTDFDGLRRVRRGHHLRAHAAREDEGPRPRAWWWTPRRQIGERLRAGPARRAGEHHLSRHHRGARSCRC